MLSGSCDGTIRVWNLDTYSQEYLKKSELSNVYCAYRIPETPNVAIAGYDPYNIMILDIETSRYILTLKNHTNCVLDMKWSEKLNQLVSISRDKTVRFWDIESGLESNKI